MYKYIKNYLLGLITTLPILTLALSQSQQDLNKLIREYENNNKSLNQEQIDQEDREFKDFKFDRKVMFEPYKNNFSKSNNDSLNSISKYFGYDFFTKRDSIEFWENLPAPINYVVGPGDEIIISLWGQTQIRKSYSVTRDGKIYDEQVGILNVSGKTISQLKQYLILQFGRTYATLRGQNPTTFIDVSLGELRMINVNFVGQVNFPGVYAVHPFSNLIYGLIQSGGVDTTGTLRKISIKRIGEDDRIIDLYDYFINGDLPENIQLKDQDVVFVPIRTASIKIDSAVYKSKIYETLEGETLFDIIKFAGGLKPEASTKINIDRLNSLENRKGDDNNYYSIYVDLNQSKKIKILDGDKIKITSVFKSLSKVEVIGQVKRPGSYDFYEGMKLKHLISLAGGFEDTTYIKSIFLDQAEIIRKNKDTRYEKIIKLDLNNFEESNLRDFRLQNLDRLVIHENLNFYERKNIKISGEVNIPGSYPLISDNETLLSVIERSGGLSSKALEDGISIFRNQNIDNQSRNNSTEENRSEPKETKMRVAWTDKKITLMPGDSIVVKEKSKSVVVIGEVYNSGIIEYKRGKKLNYYLSAAGGVTDNANKNGIIVIYPNGMVSPGGWFNNAKIKDGSTIIINEKEYTEPFNITQFATNWTSIISSMITAIVLSQQIQNN